MLRHRRCTILYEVIGAWAGQFDFVLREIGHPEQTSQIALTSDLPSWKTITAEKV